MHRLLPTFALVLLLPIPAAPQATSEAVQLEYVEETLPNGLRVLYHVDRSNPVAAAVVWYDVASKHEAPGRTGFAHLFEHLMLFTGSRNVPEGRGWALLEAAGGRAGPDLNGTTSADRTNYFSQVPSNALELALWIEADRMATLDDALTQTKLDNQRDVVKNERRQGVDNQPYGLWGEKMLGHLFPRGHPYNHPVIGWMEDLDAATLDDVRHFFRTYYVPGNAVLVVAGDFELEDARRMVRLYFGPIPAGRAPPPLRDATLPPLLGTGVREVIEDANAPAPAVYVGFRMPNARDAHAPVVSMLPSMLASGRSSPLFASLVRRQQVATNVFAFNFGFVDGADMMVVAAIGRPGASADSLERALLAELDGVDALIDEVGLRRVQASTRFGLVNQLQAMGGFGGRGDMLAQGWTFHRDPGWVNTWVQRLGEVTVAQVRELARERLVPDNRVVLVFVPRQTASTTPAGTQP
jgi:zinc protease